jgi:(heptosyl)LPS beta-1,4-glucosyltransferase
MSTSFEPSTDAASAPSGARPAVSIVGVVVARNAAALLTDCLRSLEGVDALLVVDNRSTDHTSAVARQMGARVLACAHEDMGRLREFARRSAQDAGARWMIMIDADERLPAGGVTDVRNAIGAAPDTAAFVLPIQTFLGQRWLRWGGYYPARRLRIFQLTQVRWRPQRVHETADCTGPIRHLDCPLRHLSYRDLAHVEAKLRRYAAWAAEADRAVGRRRSGPSAAVRASWRFLKVAVLRHGWLMGRLGWRLAGLQARSVWWRYR